METRTIETSTGGVRVSTLNLERKEAPCLGAYLDFRLYLKDFYSHKRSHNGGIRPYSYSVFSAAANIKSPGYLRLIIDGKRNLSDGMIEKFSRGLRLSKEEREEFFLMVKYGQSSDPALRNIYLKKLSEFRVHNQISRGQMDGDVWDKVPGWVSWALYALVDVEGVEFDIKKLRRRFQNRVTESEIRLSLEKLFSSGDLICDEVTGKIKRAENKKPKSIPVELVRKLQGELMYLGLESLFHDDPVEREFGALTLALTEKEFNELKFQLRKMKKSVQKDNFINRMNSKGEKLYQLNLQLYPLTTGVETTGVETTGAETIGAEITRS